MTCFVHRLLLFLTLMLLAACASEMKQSEPAKSQAGPTQPAKPAPPAATSRPAAPARAQAPKPAPAKAPPAPAPAPTPPVVASQPPPAPAPAPQETKPQPDADGPKHLMISVGRANLRENPDVKSRILNVLTKGTKLDVVSKGDQWYRVKTSNGTEGWVAESVVTAAD
jgi:uncharacterized protein YgiM (DUF1202 family)